MEMKPTYSFLELRNDLNACWQVSGQKAQCVALLAQCVARLWCVAHEQINTGKIVLIRSAPWVRSAPQLMRSVTFR